MQSETKRITLNYFYNLALQVFTLVVPLITTPYIARVLGPEKTGIYGFTLSISTYFIVGGSIGFPLFGQREIAYYANEKEKRSRVFFEVIYGQLFLLSISLVLYLLTVTILFKENQDVFYAQSIGIVGGVLATSWFYAGLEEFKITVWKNVIVKILSIAGLFLLIKKPSDVALYACIIGGANVVGNVAILFGINRYVDLRCYKVRVRDVLKNIKPAFVLGIPYFITSVYAIVDKTMLGFMGDGFAEVGYYEQSQKIITLAIAISTSLGTVIMPRMANEIGQANKQKAIKYLSKGIDASIMISFPICVGLFCVSSSIVPWFFGNGYDKVSDLIKIFAPVTVFMSISNMLGMQYMVVIKKEILLTKTILVSIVINGFFNLMLIPQFNSVGASMATLISEIIKMIVQLFLIKVIKPKTIVSSLLKYGCFSAIMGVVIVILKRLIFQAPTFINSMILIASGVVTYGIVLVVTKNEYVNSVIGMITSKIGRQRG